MDRRGFLKGVAGGGALGAMPLAAMARLGETGAAGRPAAVIAQADSPQALALARALATGLGVRPVAAGGCELGSFAGVTGLLDRAGPGRVIGVMDDASAVIFQQIAAARGAGLVMDTYRRIGVASLVAFAINT
ncbi:twin-arginine translocation signal domain-containing protein [Aromatoleum toluvorans]|uniref:Twin-arginine translocation signal domain-containing protein n=1 Tax=Aromatoleum toluvorans TaxID=92002 RepID=A0ABX1PZZ6_9RHOO|nr:twin-arginine translocation signal domain-containing protein [Aromatoleum toluvorans]NMG44272.1 twin-arginine translocation signal domain-containing protein [Aromatoleum toluvorans]